MNAGSHALKATTNRTYAKEFTNPSKILSRKKTRKRRRKRKAVAKYYALKPKYKKKKKGNCKALCAKVQTQKEKK